MQATASTSVDATSPEDIDDSAWSSLWLSGWDCWAEAYLTEEKSPETVVQVPVARRTRPTARGQDACRGQTLARSRPRPRPRSRSRSRSRPKPSGTSPEMSATTDEHMCSTCGKSLSSQNALRLHSKTHEGGRPWKCEECGACFARKDHLRVHYRVHTGERPYSCMICGNSFAHSGTLKSHIRTHTGEKPFACDACGVCFSDPSTLRMHRLKHADVKSFVCGDCGRAFASNGILNKHKRVHPNGGCVKKKGRAAVKRGTPNKQYVEEQLHPCDVCGRLLKSELSLSLHMKNHSEGGNRAFGSDEEGQLKDPSLIQFEMDVAKSKMDEDSDQFENCDSTRVHKSVDQGSGANTQVSSSEHYSNGAQ